MIPSRESAVKRSITVRRELHDAILETVGDRGYSAFVNEAILIALQAHGIDQTIADYEARGGVLTDEDVREADRRRAEAAAEAREAASR